MHACSGLDDMWQTQVENEHYSTVYMWANLSLECFIEITPDFLCPND